MADDFNKWLAEQWNSVEGGASWLRRTAGDAVGAAGATASGAENITASILSLGAGSNFMQSIMGAIATLVHYFNPELAERMLQNGAQVAAKVGKLDDAAVSADTGGMSPDGTGGSSDPDAGIASGLGIAAVGAAAIGTTGYMGIKLAGATANGIVNRIGNLVGGGSRSHLPDDLDGKNPHLTGGGRRMAGIASSVLTGAAVGGVTLLAITNDKGEDVGLAQLDDGSILITQDELDTIMKEEGLDLPPESVSPNGYYVFNSENDMLLPIEAVPEEFLPEGLTDTLGIDMSAKPSTERTADPEPSADTTVTMDEEAIYDPEVEAHYGENIPGMASLGYDQDENGRIVVNCSFQADATGTVSPESISNLLRDSAMAACNDKVAQDAPEVPLGRVFIANGLSELTPV